MKKILKNVAIAIVCMMFFIMVIGVIFFAMSTGGSTARGLKATFEIENREKRVSDSTYKKTIEGLTLQVSDLTHARVSQEKVILKQGEDVQKLEAKFNNLESDNEKSKGKIDSLTRVIRNLKSIKRSVLDGAK
ncbi:MAG: hypothetical protein M3421_06335 [Bacteroidota bacterium]|nr:hypothetical protein [Bacteroidota bacterium]